MTGLIQSIQSNFVLAMIVTLGLLIVGIWMALKMDSRFGWLLFIAGLVFLTMTMKAWGLF